MPVQGSIFLLFGLEVAEIDRKCVAESFAEFNQMRRHKEKAVLLGVFASDRAPPITTPQSASHPVDQRSLPPAERAFRGAGSRRRNEPAPWKGRFVYRMRDPNRTDNGSLSQRHRPTSTRPDRWNGTAPKGQSKIKRRAKEEGMLGPKPRLGKSQQLPLSGKPSLSRLFCRRRLVYVLNRCGVFQ